MAAGSPPTILEVAVVALLGLALICAVVPAVAQNCNCQPGYCCSKDGYCGTTSAYCGTGCQSGPCSSGSGGSGGSGANVESVVSESFFNGIKAQAAPSCEGSRFYTRSAFLTVARSYPNFAHGGSEVQGKREIAAFFANVAHETGRLCKINEISGANQNYCDANKKQWPCVPGKNYYGRGPLQLTWNYNYGPAGKSLGFDGLGDPDRVAQDPVLSFNTALWFWMKYVHNDVPQGFGATIRAINGGECNVGQPARVESRVSLYKKYCQQFGVDPGPNLSC